MQYFVIEIVFMDRRTVQNLFRQLGSILTLSYLWSKLLAIQTAKSLKKCDGSHFMKINYITVHILTGLT
jgi:hypothetical protein